MSPMLAELTEGRIDFGGQHAVDSLSRIALVVTTCLSFFIGLALQDLRATFGLLTIVIFGLAFLVLPPWPMFNRHPVKWLPAVKEKGTEKTR